MCNDKVDRAKAFALSHLLCCLISGFIHVTFNAQYWYPGPAGTEITCRVLFLIYLGFIFVWCVNDIIALLGFSDQKKHLLQCHVTFGFIILVVGAPYLLWLLYYASFGKVFVKRSSIFPQILFPMMMFLGMGFSLVSMNYSYQMNKECSTTATATQNVREDIESNIQKDAKEVKEDE